MNGPFAAFDVETTGVDVETARIVSAWVGHVWPDGTTKTVGKFLINPGIPIPEGATRVHGISTDDAVRHGQLPALAIASIEAQLAAALKIGLPLVVMNAAFDLTILDREVGRHLGRRLGFDPRPVLDPLVLDKVHDRYRKGKRRLTDLAGQYGVTLLDAHNAEADATGAALIAYRLLDVMDVMHPDAIGDPPTLDDVHRWQIDWRRDQQTSLRDYFVGRGQMTDALSCRYEWPLIPRHAPAWPLIPADHWGDEYGGGYS